MTVLVELPDVLFGWAGPPVHGKNSFEIGLCLTNMVTMTRNVSSKNCHSLSADHPSLHCSSSMKQSSLHIPFTTNRYVAPSPCNLILIIIPLYKIVFVFSLMDFLFYALCIYITVGICIFLNYYRFSIYCKFNLMSVC